MAAVGTECKGGSLPVWDWLMRQRILESVVTALLLAIFGAAVSTYWEVKMLRRDVDEIRKDLDDLYIQASDQIQSLDRSRKEK